MQKLFRTVLKPSAIDVIDHFFKILMMGSCFSEHIGNKLIDRKFDVNLNPFGILYHPLAIAGALTRLVENNSFSLKDIRLEDKRYVSFYHHGKFNHIDPQFMIKNINEAFDIGREQLLKADYLFITWGTAFGYTHIDNKDRIVSNCHKIPAKNFSKTLSKPEEITDAYQALFKAIRLLNPKVKIVLTVSPVKHLKDGLVNNSLSKSVLLLSANQLQDEVNSVSYFPAYELITDDLRDYRFYAKDMAHPSEEAIEYVWDFFKKTFWSQVTSDLNIKIERVLNAVQHRPLHPENQAHQDFIIAVKNRIAKLETENPFLDFKREKKSLDKPTGK